MQDLTPQFNTAQIKAMILKRAERLEQAALSRMQRVLETALNYYRDSNTWTDRTANLRSSGGYVILRNGEQMVEGGFEPIKGATEGAETGKGVAAEVARQFPKGIVGVFVAGMGYAIHLENRGISVLTGPSLIAKEALKRAIEDLQAKARR